VLADIIFNAPSTPTQPLQANLHPVATAEKKKEIKKKETRKVADPKYCNIRLCVLLKLKFSSKKKMDSPSRSEISTEGADIRRVEFVDGRVVHLPNRMPEERVMLEVRSSQQDLQLHPSCTPIPNFLCVPPPSRNLCP
jgi:hypothetical protein